MLALLQTTAFAQSSFTWEQIKDKFEAGNPTLRAAKDNIDESRAEEITAYLRPNPDFTLTTDGFQISRNQGVWRPFSGVFEVPSFSYLHERQHKRELRLQSAKQTTDVTISQYADQERNLVFTLRNAFVQTLQAKAVLQNAKENLTYWDHELSVNRDRFKAGDLAEVDLDRLELQRVQFESDYETALALWEHLAAWYAAKTGMNNSTLLDPLNDTGYVFVNHARWDRHLASFMAAQLAKPSFRNYVIANLRANHVASTPILFHLA